MLRKAKFHTSPETVSQRIVRLSLAQEIKKELSMGHHTIAITPAVRNADRWKIFNIMHKKTKILIIVYWKLEVYVLHS